MGVNFCCYYWFFNHPHRETIIFKDEIMLKQTVALILLSILIILCMPYAQHALQWLIDGHNWISDTLTNVFSGSYAGDLIRKLLALLAIPVLIGLLPVIVYWLAKRSWFPYFMEIVWVVWLLEIGALVIQYKVIVAV